MTRGPIRQLTVSGTGRERGLAHGRAHRDEIRAYADDRVGLVMSGRWSKAPLERSVVLDLATECLEPHDAYSADLTDELRGIAEATDLSVEEVLIVGGFTDFVDTVYARHRHDTLLEDDCSAVLVPTERAPEGAMLAQTWDMHDTATEHVMLLHVRPEAGPAATVFTTTGCIGQIGLNEAGIAVGINNLNATDGRVGVTWTHVVRQVLTCTDFDSALAAITEAPLAGAHNYSLLAADGRGATIEAYPSVRLVTELGAEPLGHTNHALDPATIDVSQPRPEDLQAHSEARLGVIAGDVPAGPVGPADLRALLAHPTVCYPSWSEFHVETCGATVLRPATRELWACWGLPSENPFERFVVGAGVGAVG